MKIKIHLVDVVVVVDVGVARQGDLYIYGY